MRRPLAVRVVLGGLVLAGLPLAARAALPVVDPTVAPARETEPVVVTGLAFPDLAAPQEISFKAPLTDLADCPNPVDREGCAHNHLAEPELSTGRAGLSGPDVGTIAGFRWDGTQYVEIPFQVDEVYTRYLSNPISGFAGYSGEDPHTSYAFDREGFRFTRSAPGDPCQAVPDSPLGTDPVPGLDTDDELVFMARDAGAEAPAEAPLPAGVTALRAIAVVDPFAPGSAPTYVYMGLGRKPAFDRSNGYVRYERDANADVFVESESAYGDYGNAAVGPVCDEAGTKVIGEAKRRPLDRATVTTPRYRFRYDGRWLMTQLQVAPTDGAAYGPDLIDRWKARAYAIDPASEVPCCGFEEEETNWGGSSILLGEKSGPVRTIRESWGADSGTNVVRREVFYRDEFRQVQFLRVHPLPPLGGVYSYWDFNAGRMTRFTNPMRPDGIAVDGSNDHEFMGNFDDPCNEKYDTDPDRYTTIDRAYRELVQQVPFCGTTEYHFSTDVMDPASSQLLLPWTQTSGPWGTVVDRHSLALRHVTPGGAPQSFLVMPYYRDDSCFDDGTGTDPGPRLRPRSSDEPPTTSAGGPRRCWRPSDGIPAPGDEQFFQGQIAAHGVNVLAVPESDNLRTTFPLTEIVSEQRLVVLPGDPGNVGERYGRGFEKPLVAVAG